MAASDLINLSCLIDDAKCFALVRQHRWPEGVRCAMCGSGTVILAKPKVCAGTAATTRSPAGSATGARGVDGLHEVEHPRLGPAVATRAAGLLGTDHLAVLCFEGGALDAEVLPK